MIRNPSRRTTALLAAAMLAVGVAVGAAIGPAPSPSLAVGQLTRLLPALVGARAKSSASVQPPTSATQPTPQAEASAVGTRRKRFKRSRSAAASPASFAETETTTPAPSTPTSTAKPKTTPLPPVTKVWLIALAGSSFGEAVAQPTAAPYVDGQALPAGTLLSDWSALDASAFATDAALIASTPPQLLDTILQPPCPASISDDDASPEGEGAAGAQCTADTPGALTAADEFLKATLPAITSSPAYRENGLIVITFASIASATATGLPAGASTATLTSQPPAGVLLISPFAKAGAKSSAAFTATSPKQVLEKLLRR